jgi:hypothetical protein
MRGGGGGLRAGPGDSAAGKPLSNRQCSSREGVSLEIAKRMGLPGVAKDLCGAVLR